MVPDFGPRPEERCVLIANHALCPPATARQPEQRDLSGVVERIDHGGEIAQRRALDAPIVERTPGVAVEIGDDEILAGVKNASQVIVAVNSNALSAERF